MAPTLFALFERIHGHLAVLALALLLHPVLTLRRRPLLARWTVLTAEIGAAMLTAAFALGWWLYPTYRVQVKPSLLAGAHSVAMAFETKEHLAFCAVALAVGGAVALRTSGASPAGRRAAWHLLVAAWLCGAVTGVLGVFVASIAQPGW